MSTAMCGSQDSAFPPRLHPAPHPPHVIRSSEVGLFPGKLGLGLQMSMDMATSSRKLSMMPPIWVSCLSSGPLLPSSCAMGACLLDLTLYTGGELSHFPQRLEQC